MGSLSFYEIKTKKSQEYVNGVRKVSLSCADHPGVQFFLWLDQREELKQVQFLFGENLIEWQEGKRGITANETNRKFNICTVKRGVQKGTRTLHRSQNKAIVIKGLRILRASQLPPSYHQMLKQNLLPAKYRS